MTRLSPTLIEYHLICKPLKQPEYIPWSHYTRHKCNWYNIRYDMRLKGHLLNICHMRVLFKLLKEQLIFFLLHDNVSNHHSYLKPYYMISTFLCVFMYFLLFITIKNYNTMIKITTITGKSIKTIKQQVTKLYSHVAGKHNQKWC